MTLWSPIDQVIEVPLSSASTNGRFAIRPYGYWRHHSTSSWNDLLTTASVRMNGVLNPAAHGQMCAPEPRRSLSL